MRYSRLFPKTLREPPREANNASTQLLYQGGFIRESTAGRYYLMPLGLRAHNKVMAIVREEMDRAGAQEMITPVLHPLELWKETNRTTSAGFELTQVKDRRGAEFALGGTAEEMFVDVVRRSALSYRELPFNLYQFSQKFRDEMRARGGLLRVREFVMKDAYSFHTDETDFKLEYQKMWKTYQRIFDRLGLNAVVVAADNGYIGGEYCHEFVVESEVGESQFLITPDGSYAAHEDVATFTHEEVNPDDEILPLETIDQPAWVQTMEHNVKHYGLPASHYLKNVVYKTSAGKLVIGVIRGDLEVNPIKLGKAVGAIGELTPATDEDLASIGTKSGYVHSWGHEGVIYVGDHSLKTVRNFIGGQKEETQDTRNVNYGRDFQCEIEADIAVAEAGFLAPDGKQRLEKRKGVEVGNIFQLGTHYSKLMDATYIDAEGAAQHYYMGCYGIGIGRTLATVVEKFHDDKGICWPVAIAPFAVHLIGLGQDEEILAATEKVYNELTSAGIEVLWDDREEGSAGVRFADADLIGLPLRVLVSRKTLAQSSAELKPRTADKPELIALDNLKTTIGQHLSLL